MSATSRKLLTAAARRTLLAAAALVVLLAAPAAALAQSEFGIVPGSFTVRAENRDGTIDQLAGSHPYAYTLSFNLNKDGEGYVKGGNPRDVIAALPPGLFGNPLAAPRCTRAEFEGTFSNCPPETAIGIVRAVLVPGVQVTLPLFNLVPPPGVAAQLGTSGVNLNVLESASVQSEDGYRIEVGDYGLPTPISSVSETIWGVPAEASHDGERTLGAIDQEEPPVPSNAAHIPFLTLPDTCAAPLQTTLRTDSQLAPGAYAEESLFSTEAAGNPAALIGCENVPFAPLVEVAPTASSADSASGLHFHLQLPNSGLLTPEGIMEAEPEKTEVTLPPGLVANPAAASGLGACSEEQFKHATAESPGCPESSKLGTLVARTPLLEEAIEGSVYLATQHANPFGSLIALYIVASAPERGVLVKQAGEVRLDPVTGQLTAIFDHLPPLPYSSFDFDVREGPRGPLVTPSLCGAYTLQAKLYPFSQPDTAAQRSAPFTINTGAGGGTCPASEAQEPNSPSIVAGTLSPLAADYSPFVFQLTRQDGSQRFKAISETLPHGLLGKLAGVEECSQAQIEAAEHRSHEGEGRLELEAPSCPAGSELGTVTVGAGAGSPMYVTGRAYLAGPYEGAPYSAVVITPAIAGPFDLGVVVVRAALFVDPITAQVTVRSDAFPSIIDGIPLDIRSVAVNVSRGQFMFNPTSCEAMAIDGQETSTLDQAAALSDRFQVGGCQGLGFAPKLTASTSAKTSRKHGASLSVSISYPQPSAAAAASSPNGGQANVAAVHVELPKALPSRLATLKLACTEAQFATNPAGCPSASVVGSAVAHTPVLSSPLTGPAYFVSHGSAKFPELIIVLQGEGVTIQLNGETFISKAGVTSSTFSSVPDAPVSSFTLSLPEGPYSALAANRDLCTAPLRMPTQITGQNGAQITKSTMIEVEGCPKTLAIRSHSVKRRTLTLEVYVPAAGKLKVAGKGLKTQTRQTKARKLVTLRVRKRGAGHLKTKASVTFTPATGKARKKQNKQLKLKFKK